MIVRMKRSLLTLTAMICLASAAFAEPATQPATQPMNVWINSDLGKTMFHPFATAPFPHPSRADGWTNSAGTKFGPEHYQDSTVALFVPRGYTPGDRVDLVFYFHGHVNHVSKAIEQFGLREQIVKSGVNAILVLPQGPYDAADSSDGKLERDDGGFARFVAEVTAYLKAEGVTTTDRIGNIAVAPHSGGYQVTASLLHRGGLNDHITDVFLLDASYGGLQWFSDFAKEKPGARLVSFHTKHLDDENVEMAKLMDKDGVAHRDLPEADMSPTTIAPVGVTFISTTLAHNDVPTGKDYLALLLKTSQLSKMPTK